MSPRGFLRQGRGRCASMLSATVLCSLVSLAYCGTMILEQTPAQDRFFESLLGGGGGWGAPSPPPAPPMNIPDVAGFGMYPLWKFHKFDGLSLRPVPYGVDIGSGIPPSPSPPAYPTGFLSSPQQQANPPYYGPPSSPPATNYEASAPQNPPQQYGNSAPQNYGSAPSYGMSAAPSYEAQPTNSYQPNTINLSYSPVPNPPQKYNEAPQAYNAPAAMPQSYNAPAAPQGYNAQAAPQGYNAQQAPQGYNAQQAPQSYNAPSATNYGEPQSYGSPQSYGGAPMNAPQSGYDSYGQGSGITIQFSAAPQDYQQQQQPSNNYGGSPSASYQMPTYTAIESPMAVSYPPMQEPKPMQMDTGVYGGGGGFMKRNSPGYEKDSSKKSPEAETST